MTQRRTSILATVLFLLTVAEVVTAGVAGWRAGTGILRLPDGDLTVSNSIIGLSLAAAGWPIGRHRPGNPLGWLLLAGGVGYAMSGAGFALLAAAAEPGTGAPGWRLVATLTNGGWPWAIAVFLPLILLLFPDGHLAGRRWRWVAVLACVTTLGFVASAVLPTQTLSTSAGVAGYPSWRGFDAVRPVIEPVTTLVGLAVYIAAVASLVVRYRRGDEHTRRQLLWLLYGAGVMVACFVASSLLRIDGLVTILPVVLVPVSIAIAVLRYQLLDIRLVVSRSVLYALLTAGVVAAYAGLVAALRRQVGADVIATLMIAAAFNPVRVWLQRMVDRAFYGARRDPVRALAEVGARLGEVGPGAPAGLDGVLEALCRVMRLPSASIVVDGREISAYGQPPPLRQSLPLRQGGDLVGELTVGLRPGESRPAPADEKVLALLSTSLAVAVRATLLATQLGHAREALVTAREEERQRLQRDLHDGLGPALTGVVLKADAARRLAMSDPQRAADLMGELRAETTATIDGIRRLVNELRPLALDGLGLVGALREQAGALTRRVDGTPLRITVEAPALPRLPAAVEVAAYRIAMEALTNVTRHSTATAATVSLSSDDRQLTLVVRDNGGGNGGPWRAGVGLTSMRERAAELGGTCHAGPDSTGGRISVTLPV
jgi:signal transduction histidine kinase